MFKFFYKNKSDSIVEIKLFDIIGNPILSLGKNKYLVGNHSKKINIETLNSGLSVQILLMM